jgi:hypothetical protein
MGTCAVAIKKRDIGIGDHVEVTADVTLSASYATGGDTVTLASLGLKTLRSLILTSANTASAAGLQPLAVVHGASEVTDPKIMVGNAATPQAEVTAATNLSALAAFRVVAKGDHAFG